MKKIIAIIALNVLVVFCFGQTINYQYDNLGRLKKVDYPDSTSIVYTYDNGGNRVTKVNNVPCSKMPTAITTAGGVTTFCLGDSVKLTATFAGNYPVTYVWSNGDTTQSILAKTSGSYSVAIKYSVNGCVHNSNAIPVTVHSLPTPMITADGITTFCQGDSVKLDAGSGFTHYQWSSGDTTQIIAVSNSGNFTVAVKDNNGCLNVSPAKPVSVNPLPPIPIITPSGSTTICQNNNVVLTSDVATSYQWSNNSTAQSITVSSAGDYSVIINNINGCSTASNITAVIVNPLPIVAITQNGATTFCLGDSVILSSNLESSYLWSNNDTTQSIKVLSADSYYVTVADSNSCTATSSPLSVMVNALPTAIITPGGVTTFCQGGSVTLVASMNSSYVWSNGNTNQNIIVSSSGDYSVTTTDANGCSASSAPMPITVDSLPIVNITPSGVTTFCQNDSVVLVADPFATYIWNTGNTAQSITVYSSGSFIVTISDINGCSDSSSIVNIIVNPLPPAPSIAPSGSTTFCKNGNVILSSDLADSFFWNTGNTSQSITVDTSGNYFVKVMNTNGCSATSTAIPVSVHPLPIALITPNGATSFCQGGSVTLDAGAGFTNYQWNPVGTNQSIIVADTGSYFVTVTDANGCSNISSVTPITVYAPQNGLSINQNNDTLFSPYTQQNYWYIVGTVNPVDSGSFHICGQVGNYYAKGNDANGCSAISDTLYACTTTIITTENSNSLDIQLYPNPNSGVFTIKKNNSTSEIQIEIFDLQGKLIYKTITEKSQFQIDLSKEAKGDYTYRIISNGKIIKTKMNKIIIQ